MELEYANAYSEVLEILSYLSKEDYDKIPKEKIDFFETKCNKNYNFYYDMNKTLDEQDVSKKAKIIIAILFRDYWATDKQREKIKAKEEYDRNIRKQEISKNYNNQENKNLLNKNKIIVYEESRMRKLISKILNWLGLR